MIKLIFIAVVTACSIFITSSDAVAHNVWMHAQQNSPKGTLKAFRLAADPCGLERSMMIAWYETSNKIELGVIAEMESKISGTSLEPHHFKETYEGLKNVKSILGEYRQSLKVFKKFLNEGETESNFDAQLTSVLAEAKLSRISLVNERYSDVAGKKEKVIAPVGIIGLVSVLIEDANKLEKILDETIVATREALPLAEKGDFAKVMLSGRNKFGDKMPQLSDAMSQYDRLYTDAVLSTIASTMQVYPKGFEFLD